MPPVRRLTLHCARGGGNDDDRGAEPVSDDVIILDNAAPVRPSPLEAT